jgi:hypothetical protein
VATFLVDLDSGHDSTIMSVAHDPAAQSGSNDEYMSVQSSNESTSVRAELGYSLDGYDASDDDDTDISFNGGAYIPLSSSDPEQLNAEMDMLDAEIMGIDNAATIAATSGFTSSFDQTQPHTYEEHFPNNGSLAVHGINSIAEEVIGAEESTAVPISQSFANAISEQLSQQLQMFQDEQDNLEDDLVPSLEQHGAIPMNGTTFLNPSPSTQSLTLEVLSYVSGIGSLAVIPSISEPLPSLISYPTGSAAVEDVLHVAGSVPSTAQLAGGANSASSSMGGAMVGIETGNGSDDAIDGPYTSLFLLGDFTTVNEANTAQVEDQRNLTLFDFLYSWGASATRFHPRKRKRGPNLLALAVMRGEEPVQTLREDLRGERRDFQRLDWTKLEVSRREARQYRNSIYINYTNLRLPPYHVSITTCSITSY